MSVTTVTATSLTHLINDDSIDASVAEEIINHAVDLLNMYGEAYGIPLLAHLQGAAGSMTMTYRSGIAAAVVSVAVVVYNQDYKMAGASTGSSNLGVAGLSMSSSRGHTSSGESNSAAAVALDAVKTLARLNMMVMRG